MSELIAWARAYDLKVKAMRRERERHEAVYRQVLREEKHDLHDVEANRFRKLLFFNWLSRRRKGNPK